MMSFQEPTDQPAGKNGPGSPSLSPGHFPRIDAEVWQVVSRRPFGEADRLTAVVGLYLTLGLKAR